MRGGQPPSRPGSLPHMSRHIAIKNGLCVNTTAPSGLDDCNGRCAEYADLDVVDCTHERWHRSIPGLEARHALDFVGDPAGWVDEHEVIGPNFVDCFDVYRAQGIIQLLLKLPNLALRR